MKLFEKRIRFGLLVLFTTFLFFSCGNLFDNAVNAVTGNDKDLPFLSNVTPKSETKLKAGSAVEFSFECDELDIIRVSYQDDVKEIEYEYIRKGADGKFKQTLWIPKKATEVCLYVVKKGQSIYDENNWKVRRSYEVTDTYSFGEFPIPAAADYAAIAKYRTDEPEAVVDTWIADAALEATRKSNPYQYVKDVSAKIKAQAPNDKFMQVKLIHDLLARLLPYDVVGVNQSPMPPQDYWTTLSTGICVCQGYALTFNKFCEMMDIDCDYVFGKGKNETHAWDIVKIDNKCYLVDCTWDAGNGVKENGTLVFKPDYSTSYLFQRPEIFIFSHYPTKNDAHQLLAKKVTEEQFKAYPEITPKFFDAIENPEDNPLFKVNGPITSADGTYSFSYKMKKANEVFYISVYNTKDLSKRVDNSFGIEYGETQNTVKFSFPEAGEYKITITLLKDGAKSGSICADFRIKATTASNVKYVKVYHPLNSIDPINMLKSGETYSFKTQFATTQVEADKFIENVYIRFLYLDSTDNKYYYLSKFDKQLEKTGDNLFTGEIDIIKDMDGKAVARAYIIYSIKDAEGNTIKDTNGKVEYTSAAVYDVVASAN